VHDNGNPHGIGSLPKLTLFALVAVGLIIDLTHLPVAPV
jgi:hypothetical protein